MSDKKKKHEEEHENEERWLLTYADLITLLMAFFMVMFALSQLDANKFKALAVSLGQAFNSPGVSMLHTGVGNDGSLSLLPRQPRPKPVTEPDPEGTTATRPKYKDIKEVMAEFKKLVKESGLNSSVSVATNAKGDKLIVRLSDSLLFGPGSAELTEPARPLMDQVATILLLAGMPVRIEGHTDNIPPRRGGRYETNWPLSTDRATNVLMYLVTRHGMSPEKLEAGGCAEYRPVASNDTPEGRAKNRRVEFVILDRDSGDGEEAVPASEEVSVPAAQILVSQETSQAPPL